MTSKERFIAALERRTPDRLPVTSHDVMPYFLNTYMNGISMGEFWDYFGLDPILYTLPLEADPPSDEWRLRSEELPGHEYPTTRHYIDTPKGTLTMVTQSNQHTVWVTEHLIKEKKDIELIGAYAPTMRCDVAAANKAVAEFGQRGLARSYIWCSEIYGQPGCWQDASCMVGIERLIVSAFEDPEWVHELLGVILRRKLAFAETLKGAQFDVLELGGGDASSTVISPAIFDDFVAPYDSQIIRVAHKAGQRIVYHTCGGMMPFLERIADMRPDAMETFTPAGMGGDTNLREAKRRIGDRVCMIGGFDQFHYFLGCTPEQTRKEVRRCFEEAGEGGGYILCVSDHFFDADIELIKAYADEARACTY